MAQQKKKPVPASKKPAAAKKQVAPVKKASAGAAKKVASKKAVGKKTVTSKVASAKTVPAKKNAVAPKAAAKKTAKPIIKSAPAKKTATPVAKNAAPKKLATPNKSTATRPAVKDKKAPVASAPAKKSIVATATKKQPEATGADHKQMLKSAVAKSPDKVKEKKESSKPFVMPKTSTEKSRKYEPQFVKSVLDQVPEENSGPSMRYSDNELTEFRDLITRKLETAKKELGYLQGLITRKDEMGGDDTDNRYMTMEDGSLSMEREQLSQMASRQITFIDHLEKAMMRIENKTYGICRVTGKLIDKARLRAVPHATLSIEAKMGISK